MLFDLHLFGISDNTYLQYPLDGTEDTLRQCALATTNGGRLSIVREGTLQRYVFTRNIQSEDKLSVMGIAISFNGLYFGDIHSTIKLFEKVFTHIVTKGAFLKITNDGSIVFNVSSFIEKPEELRQTQEYVEAVIEAQSKHLMAFKDNFAGFATSSKNICASKDNEDILALTDEFATVNVILEEDNEVSYFTRMMSQLSEENKQLKEDYDILLKQKKQFKNVIMLLLIVVGCGIGIYILYSSLSNTQNKLDVANQNIEQQENLISEQRATITNKDDEIIILKDNYDKTKKKLAALQTDFDKYRGQIADCQPILFISSDFSFSNGYFVFTYFGLTEGSFKFEIRIIHPDGQISNVSKDIQIQKGTHEESVYISRGFDSAKYYCFEVLYHNKVIGGGRH